MTLMANEPNWKGKIRNFSIWPYMRHNFNVPSRANGGFYEENDEILKDAIAFTADEPKIWVT